MLSNWVLAVIIVCAAILLLGVGFLVGYVCGACHMERKFTVLYPDWDKE